MRKMPPHPDDLTPEQRGRAPAKEELRRRRRRMHRRYGEWGRLRSWATVAVGIAVVIACYLLFRHGW
jgi:type VI protein secretion system component VasF